MKNNKDHLPASCFTQTGCLTGSSNHAPITSAIKSLKSALMKKVHIAIATMLLFTACNETASNNTSSTDTGAVATTPSTTESSETAAPPDPVPNTIMTEAYVKNLVTSIYLWGWPMANIYNRVLTFRP